MDGIAIEFIIVIGIILLIIISKVSRASNRKKREEYQKKSKENMLNNWIDKLKSNEKIQEWVKDATLYCAKIIAENTERDLEFDFLAYNQDFTCGMYLQQKYLVNIREFVNIEEPINFLTYNFTKNGLPELKNLSELNNFAHAFAELVKKELEPSGANISVHGKIACIKSDGSSDYDEDTERFIYYLKYTRVTVNGSW